MYPSFGSGNRQSSASQSRSLTSASQPNSARNTIQGGFSSMIPQPTAQNTSYAVGQPSQIPPYQTASPLTSSSSHASSYLVNTPIANTNNYSPYSLPNFGQQPSTFQGGSSSHQTPYPQASFSNQPPSAPPSINTARYQNPYPPPNPYQPSTPYQQWNVYPPQQGNYPQNNPQQQSFPNPYPSSYSQQPQGGGYNTNFHNERLRAIAGKYEISDALLQRLNILQQFEIVVLCDDSGSMNTPVDGTTGTRWDELRAIVQIIIDIGTIFDSNGVDVHFLNRPPMLNVTDPRQVVESFSKRPQGFTPLTPALRGIFQSAASKLRGNKRLLVFVATDGEPTDNHGNVDVQSLENLMQHERQSNTMYVTFLACTDDQVSVDYLSRWDRTMINVDVMDDYKSEREEVRQAKGFNYPFSFGDYVVKALIGAVDPEMDALDERTNTNKRW
ncbi:unnamed protein product [Rotaria sp. Silwood1]|nr:unnamed protein product [Rotaria sp. Silwood1]CAF1452467.1 unnamed protein product [Rotaria sp. Silwood1]CAF3657159.1 unnamed protein product [Rotaria sp. Silwood1]CAF4734571.1 unnamed protein product [Rotaria sp. Silwood1]CAF4943371.1 unnamed protein product [Rotaria sp. Silwood1]